MITRRHLRKSLLVAVMLSTSVTCTGCAQILIPIITTLIQAGIQAYAANKANEAASEGDYGKATLIQAAGNVGGQVAGGVVQGLGNSFANSSASQGSGGVSGPEVQQQQQQQQQQQMGYKPVSAGQTGYNIGTAIGGAFTGSNQQQGNSGQVGGKPETGIAVSKSDPNLQQTGAVAVKPAASTGPTWSALEQKNMAEYEAWKAKQPQAPASTNQSWSALEQKNMAEYQAWKNSVPAKTPTNAAPQQVASAPVATTQAGNNWLYKGGQWVWNQGTKAVSAVVQGTTGLISGAVNGAVEGVKAPYKQEESPNGI